MNRFALIIESSDVRGQTDLPGARKDAINWKNFLMSDAGGAWAASEIKVFNKPSCTLVSRYLEDHQQDYCFVAYSGHGCEIKRYSWEIRGIPTVCLNEDEQRLFLSQLRPRGIFGTLIVDSCRGYELMQKTASNFGDRSGARSMSAEDSANSISAHSHRRVWDQALKQCCDAHQGVLTMYSCSSGQSADENPDSGGIYTNLLIKMANSWYSNAMPNKYYTTLMAHDGAKRWMDVYSPQQTPEYNSLPIEYPFAVKA